MGETITVLTPRSGGYGYPYERDAEFVLADVQRGFLSREAARQVCGVALSDECDSIDTAATEKLRGAPGRAVVGHGEAVQFDFGVERINWETVVAQLMKRINSALSSVSPSARMVLRRELFAEMNRTLRKAEPLDVVRLSLAVDPLKTALLEIEAR